MRGETCSNPDNYCTVCPPLSPSAPSRHSPFFALPSRSLPTRSLLLSGRFSASGRESQFVLVIRWIAPPFSTHCTGQHIFLRILRCSRSALLTGSTRKRELERTHPLPQIFASACERTRYAMPGCNELHRPTQRARFVPRELWHPAFQSHDCRCNLSSHANALGHDASNLSLSIGDIARAPRVCSTPPVEAVSVTAFQVCMLPHICRPCPYLVPLSVLLLPGREMSLLSHGVSVPPRALLNHASKTPSKCCCGLAIGPRTTLSAQELTRFFTILQLL